MTRGVLFILVGSILCGTYAGRMSCSVMNAWASEGLTPSHASDPTLKGHSDTGREIFNGKGFCYQCHGYDGYVERLPQLDPDRKEMLAKMDPKPADFRDVKHLKSKNDRERFETIKHGHSGTAMFPKGFLSDGEIADLVAYLSVLRREGKSSANP